VVSVAAGDDFQFKDLRSWNCHNFVVPAEEGEKLPQGEAQMNLRSSWGSNFKNITGVGIGTKLRPIFEDGLTVEDICLRYSTRVNVEPRIDVWTDLGAIESGTPAQYWMDNFDAIVAMFRYVRGSVKFKFTIENDEDGIMNAEVFSGGYRIVAAPVTRFPTLLAGDGVVSNHSDQNRVLEVEFPYMSQVDWKPTNRFGVGSGVQVDTEPYPLITFPDVTNAANYFGQYFVAAGADFQLAWLLPPPDSIEDQNPRQYHFV